MGLFWALQKTDVWRRELTGYPAKKVARSKTHIYYLSNPDAFENTWQIEIWDNDNNPIEIIPVREFVSKIKSKKIGGLKLYKGAYKRLKWRMN